MDLDKAKGWILTASTTAILCYSVCGERVNLPTQTMNFKPLSSYERPWQESLESSKYGAQNLRSRMMKNEIEIIHQFASHLLENSEDLEPQIVKMVNKHFWDLI